MKTPTLLAVLFLFFQPAFAQQYFPQQTLKDTTVAAVAAYVKEIDPWLKHADVDIELTFYKRSVASLHYTFAVVYQHIPLFQSTIKVNTDHRGKLLSLKKENADISQLVSFDFNTEKLIWEKTDLQSIFHGQYPVSRTELNIDVSGEQPALVMRIDCFGKTYDHTYIVNRKGETIAEWNNSRFLKKDSLIHGKIFKPDPLTSLSQTYGAPYIDDADNNLPWFGPAYLQQDVLATFETTNNTFYLENELVTIADFDAPTIAPVTSATPDFLFNRSESGFEDVNTLYHITAFHDYIASIGYDTLLKDGITVDTHGMLGADNSMFNRNGGNPTLDFGTGGVDDAEDADVIIHEYCHGLSWSANGNDNFSNPRMGLDEGLADYFATSYSRAINPFQWEKMFSWDGHNEYWGGRIANTANNYPAGANIYAVGEVWNAAMSSIWTDLGQIVTDKLMLEAMHFFTNNTTLSEAAYYVMQCDTILFNGLHANTICAKFQNKNILTANCLPSAVEEVKKSAAITISNSYGFAFLHEALRIGFKDASTGTLTLYDLTGKEVYTHNFRNSFSETLHPDSFAAGMYVLRIATETDQKTIKLNRR